MFGGTFDPPHTGHLIVAQDAALALGLDRVVFMPAAVPPHKQHSNISPPTVRQRMIELAIAGDPAFTLDTLELERTGPSYTVDTLRELQRRSSAEWTLLLGADQYAEFHTWREPEEIRCLARIAVLERGGAGVNEDPSMPAATHDGTRGGVTHIRVTRIDISSTAIRERVAAGRSIRYLVPPAVETFIHDTGLYVRNGTPRAG